MKVNELFESASSVYDDLVEIGLEDVSDEWAKKSGLERRFNVDNIDPKKIDTVLKKHEYDMVTRTKRGAALDPYLIYKKEKAYNQSTVELHYRNGKVHYLTFNNRSPHD